MKRYFKSNIVNFNAVDVRREFSDKVNTYFQSNYSNTVVKNSRDRQVLDGLMNFSKDTGSNKIKQALINAGVITAGAAVPAGAAAAIMKQQGIEVKKNVDGQWTISDADARKVTSKLQTEYGNKTTELSNAKQNRFEATRENNKANSELAEAEGNLSASKNRMHSTSSDYINTENQHQSAQEEMRDVYDKRGVTTNIKINEGLSDLRDGFENMTQRMNDQHYDYYDNFSATGNGSKIRTALKNAGLASLGAAVPVGALAAIMRNQEISIHTNADGEPVIADADVNKLQHALTQSIGKVQSQTHETNADTATLKSSTASANDSTAKANRQTDIYNQNSDRLEDKISSTKDNIADVNAKTELGKDTLAYKGHEAYDSTQKWANEKAQQAAKAGEGVRDWANEKAQQAVKAGEGVRDWANEKAQQAVKAGEGVEEWANEKAHELSESARGLASSSNNLAADMMDAIRNGGE